MSNKKKIYVILPLLTSGLLPLISANPYLIKVVTIMLIFIMYSSAWNLLAYSGQASLGHAAFFGIGGYASAIISKSLGLSPIATVFVGGVIAAILGLGVGIICLRLREWFLAMVTFGVPLIAQTLTVTNLAKITGGWDGIPAPRLVPPTYTSFVTEYYIILLFTIATIFVIYKLMKSKIGFALSAIRQNELEAKMLGVDVTRYKLIAFVVSTYIAGVAGALEIHHIGYITPEIYGADISFWPIIYSISGGLGTLSGPIVGTVIITVLWEFLKFFGLTFERYIMIGAMLILIVIFLPKGLVSLRRGFFARDKAS